MTTEKQSKPDRSTRVVIGLGIMWITLALVIVFLPFFDPPKIDIEWETETEIETAGFNIYRSDTADGEFIRINDQIIPSQSDAVSGATYNYADYNVERGKTYYYQLEDIEYDNTTQRHDVLIGKAPGRDWWTIPLSLFSSVVGILMIVSGFRQRKMQ